MDPLRNSAQLQQFMCALQYMRSSVALLMSFILPGTTIPMLGNKKASKQNESQAAGISIVTAGWENFHDDTFHACKMALQVQVILSHVIVQCGLSVNTNHICLIWYCNVRFTS